MCLSDQPEETRKFVEERVDEALQNEYEDKIPEADIERPDNGVTARVEHNPEV